MLVLKTSVPCAPWVRIPPPPPILKSNKMKLFTWTWAEVSLLVLSTALSSYIVYDVFKPKPTELDLIVDRFNIQRVYSGDSWCSVWDPYPGVTVSAEHCRLSEVNGYEVGIRSPGVIDGAIYGGKMPERPRAMVEGESVIMVGFPARSEAPVMVRGSVHIKRIEPGDESYANPGTVIRLKNGMEPVVSGMSGGAVVSADDMTPLGIIVTVNGRADITNDGIPDDSADATELHDLWLIQ